MKFLSVIPVDHAYQNQKKKKYLALTKENLKPLDDAYKRAQENKECIDDWSQDADASTDEVVVTPTPDKKKMKVIHMIKPLKNKTEAR